MIFSNISYQRFSNLLRLPGSVCHCLEPGSCFVDKDGLKPILYFMFVLWSSCFDLLNPGITIISHQIGFKLNILLIFSCYFVNKSCVCVCTCVCVFVCTNVYSGQRSTLAVFQIALHLTFWDSVSHWTWSSSILWDWLTNPPVSTLGVGHSHHNTWFFWEFWGITFRSSSLQIRDFTGWAIF